jgi:hypothetical protein
MAEERERRYPIKTHESYGFFAGVTPDKTQVLMGLCCPNLVAFFFDSKGGLLKLEKRSITFFQSVTPPYDIYDDRIPVLIDAWKTEVGFHPITIMVKKFFSRELYIGIEDYPDHFEEILSDPKACEEEKNDIRDSIRLWDKAGQFVLLWGNDYWLDRSGEVVSS